MNIATWNVRTLLDSNRKESINIPRKTAVVAREMERLNIDIAALQETIRGSLTRLWKTFNFNSIYCICTKRYMLLCVQYLYTFFPIG